VSEYGGRWGYLGECYWPGVDEHKLGVTVARTRSTADHLRRRDHDVRFLGSILVPADETVFWMFEGDEDGVRMVSEEAGVAFERVLHSLCLDGRAELG
jgi:hypothetical protein